MIRTVRLLAILLFVSTAMAQSGAHSSRQDQTERPTSVTIQAGTVTRVELQNQLSSKLNEVGDEVVGILENSIIVDGIVALRKGTEVRGHIAQVSAAKRMQRQASMSIVLDRIITSAGEIEIATTIK